MQSALNTGFHFFAMAGRNKYNYWLSQGRSFFNLRKQKWKVNGFKMSFLETPHHRRWKNKWALNWPLWTLVLKTIVEDKWVLSVLGKALVEGHSQNNLMWALRAFRCRKHSYWTFYIWKVPPHSRWTFIAIWSLFTTSNVHCQL